MRRRDVLRACAGGLAATVAASATAAADEKTVTDQPPPKSNDKAPKLAGACGLFCGACGDMREGRCHGCGCSCGECVAASHAKHCKMVNCTAKKGLSNCGDCRNFPCTDLVMHTHDPVWRSHAPSLDNIRRRKAVGTDAWISEQQKFWADHDNRKKWALADQEAMAKVATLRKDHGYTRAFRTHGMSVIALRYDAELPIRDIAEALKTSEKAVERLLVRVRKALRGRLMDCEAVAGDF